MTSCGWSGRAKGSSGIGSSWSRNSCADREKIGATSDATDAVEEFAGRFHAESDEVHVFLHVMRLRRVADLRRAHGFEERVHVGEDVAAGRAEDRLAATRFADLAKEPGIADHAAADHQAACASQREDFVGFRSRVNVAVRENGTIERGDGARDEFVARHAAIHLLHRPRVNRQQVDRMSREDRQQLIEDRSVVEADPRFYRERDA